MRPLRINAAGLLYHVMARGNARQRIFLDAEDYSYALHLLDASVERYGLECHAFCLMPNHYHLAVGTTQPNLSAAIQHWNGAYGQWWNWRHSRIGHVFQGRFKAQVVEAAGYFANLVRYILRNPLRAGLVTDVANWPWSSFLATAGRQASPPFLTVERVLSMSGARERGVQIACFVTHVTGDDHAEEAIAELVRSDARVIGSEAYREQFADAARGASGEVPGRERRWLQPTLQRFFQDRICTRPLSQLMLEAHEHHAYRLSDIALALGLPPKTVSGLIRAAREDAVTALAPLTGRIET